MICFVVQVLVDGPQIKRQPINFKRVALTNFSVEIPRSCRHGVVMKAFEKAEIESKWDQTAWAKKLRARKARAELSDFDRFKVMVNRKKRSQIVNKAVAKSKSA
jgi:large subunit ribosomal protein L14e